MIRHKACEKILLFLVFTGIFILSSCQKVNKNAQNKAVLGKKATKKAKDMSETQVKEAEMKVSEEEVDSYQAYIDFFEEVYKTMQENYYGDVSRDEFDRFIKQFDTKIYAQLQGTGKSIDYIRWRSAALLVDFLKSQEDVFSAFYPPKPAKEYEQTALGRRMDLGIEGEFAQDGFKTTHVEPRSDAYKQGLRQNDLILKIDGQELISLTEEEVKELLNPLVDTKVSIQFLGFADRKRKDIQVVSQDYFKQTVFSVPTKIPYIYCLKIQSFNRKTSEDLFRYLKHYSEQGPIKGLIIDLRGNPGGPPLAAREISGFFLPGGDDFAYFHKKGHPRAMLDVPKIPEKLKYDGPMVILVDQKSGSASELFSGILQRRRRAVLMGTNSAGQVMLKSMFHFDDESMLLLITSRGHHPDGAPFSFQGLTPDRRFKEDEEVNVIDYATTYLVYVNKQDKRL